MSLPLQKVIATKPLDSFTVEDNVGFKIHHITWDRPEEVLFLEFSGQSMTQWPCFMGKPRAGSSVAHAAPSPST